MRWVGFNFKVFLTGTLAILSLCYNEENESSNRPQSIITNLKSKIP
jgi:hypothetical protein